MAVSPFTPLARPQDRRFYGGMALLIAAIVFAGFSRTFYLSRRPGRADAVAPADRAWSRLLRLDRAVHDANGAHRRRTQGHSPPARRRDGAVLAAAMVVVGTILAIRNAREGRAPRRPPLPFLIIPLFDMLVFAPLVAAAVWYRRRSETHSVSC